MSYTIVNDSGVIQIRASVNTPGEISELIAKLEAYREKMLAKEEKPE